MGADRHIGKYMHFLSIAMHENVYINGGIRIMLSRRVGARLLLRGTKNWDWIYEQSCRCLLLKQGIFIDILMPSKQT